MKHALPADDRIQDPAGIIPADEPVFLLRGQDSTAAGIVRLYADRLRSYGGDPELIRAAFAQAEAMENWPHRQMPNGTRLREESSEPAF